MTTREYKNNQRQLHRDGGLPAVVRDNGDQEWWVNGKRHRDGGLPAIELANGSKEWLIYGHHHRDGGLPAIDWSNGDQEWLEYGKHHRDGGLPALEKAGGQLKEWWVDGRRHRSGDLPALESNGDFYGNGAQWWKYGQLHREGGLPAVVQDDGKSWFINGRELSSEEAIAYVVSCEKKRVAAQKKIYFWWIQICYDPTHPSGCGKRMAQKNLEVFESMMNV